MGGPEFVIPRVERVETDDEVVADLVREERAVENGLEAGSVLDP